MATRRSQTTTVGGTIQEVTTHLHTIISGGQTGADQAALDAAIDSRIEHGGAVPLGRKTEAGRLPVT